ncbi:MAG: HAMP domain-containing histidine kinase [Clostridia bacterium]|nr:HAMP domain-containing histidine kinase [Clostridia bacterium]
MKSLFVKNFVLYALVIIVSFGVLGGAYLFQINRYAMAEKRTGIVMAAERASQSTSVYVETADMRAYLSERYRADAERQYVINMQQLASDCNGMIFVANLDGSLWFIATPEGCYPQVSGKMPPAAMTTVADSRSYSELGNFYGYLSEAHFVQGTPCVIDQKDVAAVFVAVPAESSINFFFNIISTFTIMVFAVLLMTLLVTYFIVRSTIKPLKQMASCAKSYARGDFSPRIPLPRRQDELFDVILSFNNMADSVNNMETMRRGLIANVSHDLRTPMTTIAGFVDGILDGTIKPDKQKQYLSIISEEVKRLSRLATSMLSVSRLESGEQGLSKTTFDMSEMVRRIIIGFEQKLNTKKIEVVLDTPDTLDVTADHDAIFQVAYNLIDNAVKFTNEGGTIVIFMAVKNGTLQCNVQNTGSEISQESLKYIFDRFYKEDTSRGVNRTGSGLGLYIVKTIVNRHGGDVFARSEDGKTEFCFSLPMN